MAKNELRKSKKVDDLDVSEDIGQYQDEEARSIVDLVESRVRAIAGLTSEINEAWADLLPELQHSRRPWSRQEGESESAYSAFLVYLMLGPIQRTMSLACEVYQREVKPAKDEIWGAIHGAKKHAEQMGRVVSKTHLPSYLRMWASRYDWEQRVLAWDNFFHDWVLRNELEKRRTESALMAVQRRMHRAKWSVLFHKLFDKIERGLQEDLDAKSLRDLVLAAERLGLIEAKIWEGVKDVLASAEDDAPLPPEVAFQVMTILRTNAEGRVQQAIPAREPLVIEG